jgi:hypothetical protein
MGSLVGGLTQEFAAHLGLPLDIPVIQGGPDAFVGMIGLGCISPGQLCLITGSSYLHCVVSSQPTTAQGTLDAYRAAPQPGINLQKVISLPPEASFAGRALSLAVMFPTRHWMLRQLVSRQDLTDLLR